MPKIQQLSPHVANLIAAGEVVERPTSVIKELLENAVDAGASAVTVEIREGGMTFLRVTDNGCGMLPEDARTAFLRHATSKLRSAEDLSAIATMGFRGEALAAIASVSRIDLLTKTPGSLEGISLQLEAGIIQEETEAGCPDGTTIIVRDLFFNTPARMKFMKSDTVEGSKVAAAVNAQALAHPEISFRFLRDGKELLNTPGSGSLQDAIYCVYGRQSGMTVEIDSRWEGYSVTGFVSKPTEARPSRALQTFFVNDRPVRSRLLTAALEEAYRNQIMVGKFPACVLHLHLPANAVDVNVHPAKTEVKFLSEKRAFDCIHYGVLAGLNKTPDRPPVKLQPPVVPAAPQAPAQAPKAPQKKENFFQTMTPQEYKVFTQALPKTPEKPASPPKMPQAERPVSPVLQEQIQLPVPAAPRKVEVPKVPELPAEPEQTQLPMPEAAPWRLVGELYRSYILVEQGEDAFLIDKHAAHERILFEKLKAHPEAISGQTLLQPLTYPTSAEAAGILLANGTLLEELGFSLEEFGPGTILVRQIPMDLAPEQVSDTLDDLAAHLADGRKDGPDTVRDEVLHTIACKAAIKAGYITDSRELGALARQVLDRPELKYCPHGRPICISLSKKQLEKQFRRT